VEKKLYHKDHKVRLFRPYAGIVYSLKEIGAAGFDSAAGGEISCVTISPGQKVCCAPRQWRRDPKAGRRAKRLQGARHVMSGYPQPGDPGINAKQTAEWSFI
jgi:hypothetical protein